MAKKAPEKRICFILSPIGPAGSAVRRRADQLLKHVFSPVLTDAGYEPLRADKISKVGLITSQVITHIQESPLVIADLTGGNPNVFYELALRHATGKPFIQVIQSGERIPFDIHGIRTIPINHTDLDSVNEAKVEIRQQINEYKRGHIPDSPVSIARGVKLLQSDSALAEELIAKVDRMASANQEVASIETQVYRKLTVIENDLGSLLRALYSPR